MRQVDDGTRGDDDHDDHSKPDQATRPSPRRRRQRPGSTRIGRRDRYR
jgi:hypothetical protein